MPDEIEASHRTTEEDVHRWTAKIVGAYVSRNHVPPKDLSALIAMVGRSVCGIALRKEAVAPISRRPAVPVSASVTDEWIVCLEDGKRFKCLRRHLRRSYGLSVQQYRERWSLPDDYPMVAPAYSRRRAAIARDVRLGSRSPPLSRQGA